MVTVLIGDAGAKLKELESGSVHCCVTSPPYWGLRDYGVSGQLGLENTPEDYVANMVKVFAEVKRVLREDGTLWLNIGDCYATGAGKVGDCPGGGEQGARWLGDASRHRDGKRRDNGRPFLNGRGEPQAVPTKNTVGRILPNRMPIPGLKPKDLVGVPWRVAFALQADGWFLRSDIIWAKPNPMPESVTDRPTRSHEYVFLLTKSARYYYDAEAISEPCIYDLSKRIDQPNFESQTGGGKDSGNGNRSHRKVLENLKAKRDKQRGHSRRHDGFNDRWDQMEREQQCTGIRNKRDVWTVAAANYAEAHFATFPPALIKPCILAGCPFGGAVLDPFARGRLARWRWNWGVGRS